MLISRFIILFYVTTRIELHALMLHYIHPLSEMLCFT